jgi:hypothetical protein
MAYEYGKTETYEQATRQEVMEIAERGLGGQGAVVLTTFKLMDSIAAQEQATNRLNRMLYLTIAIAILTGVLVVLGALQFYYQLHSRVVG